MHLDAAATKPYSDKTNPEFTAVRRQNRLGNLAKTVTIGAAALTIGGLGILAYLYFTGGMDLTFPIAGFNLQASTVALYGAAGAAGLAVTGGLWSTGHAVAKNRAKMRYVSYDQNGAFQNTVFSTSRLTAKKETKEAKNAVNEAKQLVKDFKKLTLDQLKPKLESLDQKNFDERVVAMNTLLAGLELKYCDKKKVKANEALADKLEAAKTKIEKVDKEESQAACSFMGDKLGKAIIQLRG